LVSTPTVHAIRSFRDRVNQAQAEKRRRRAAPDVSARGNLRFLDAFCLQQRSCVLLDDWASFLKERIACTVGVETSSLHFNLVSTPTVHAIRSFRDRVNQAQAEKRRRRAAPDVSARGNLRFLDAFCLQQRSCVLLDDWASFLKERIACTVGVETSSLHFNLVA